MNYVMDIDLWCKFRKMGFSRQVVITTRDAGYEIVPFDTRADVYVINTCSVTNMADRKSRQMLSRARKRNPQAVVVAVGCYVQTAHDRSHLQVDADILIGNNKKKDLVEILETYFAEHEPAHTEIEDVNSGSAHSEIKDVESRAHI